MARSIPLFRAGGIRITVDPSWLFIFLLVAYSLGAGYLPRELPGTPSGARYLLGAVLALALFGSVLAHEFSHALVARRRGVDVDEIMLFIFGGVARLRSEPRDAAGEFLIAVAGPLLSIGLGALLLVIGAAVQGAVPPALGTGIRWLGIINVALAVFNLIPGFPLDGGRILRAILWWRTGDFERATVGAARTGQAIAALLMGGGVLLALVSGSLSWLWEVLIGWFLWSAASRSIQIARLRDAVEGIRVRELTTDRVPAIRADHDVRVGLAQASAGDASELAVVEKDGRLAGVVTAEELREAAGEEPGRPAREVAHAPEDAQVLSPDDPAEELVERLGTLGGGRLLLVMEGDRLLGTVDPRALVSALRDSGHPEAGELPPE